MYILFGVVEFTIQGLRFYDALQESKVEIQLIDDFGRTEALVAVVARLGKLYRL